MRLGMKEIYEAALAAGFTPDQATTWTAIALAESGGETGALNDVGEHSVGLWQINVAAHGDRFGNLADPYVNARAAYEISHHGTDMRPWTTTHASHAGTSADYRSYLDDVSALTGYAGDPRGVDGYHSPLPPPLPPSGPGLSGTMTGYDQIDTGHSPLADLDSDGDGLTDAFELAIGSSPSVADTDADGLSDAHEYAVSHTSVLMADTDMDGVGDATELLLGTPAGTVTTPPAPLAGGPGSAMPSVPGATTTGFAPGGGPAATGTRADAFVQAALAQRGDSYVFGTEARLDDPDPSAFDCSELTQWAAEQAGVTIPDGSYAQYLDLKSQGRLMSVEEAMHTKGALLFYFSSEPEAGGGRPSQAHVAISLGDGRTIEARGTSYGVNEFPAAGRFNYAGLIPEMGDPAASTSAAMWTPSGGLGSYDAIDTGIAPGATADGFDTDGDGLSDAFERMLGLDPTVADSDLDGVPDAAEVLLGTAGPGGATAVAATDPTGDFDADGLSNAFEVSHGLDPLSPDTDLDGLWDSYESVLGTDPHSVDTDHDGLTDAFESRLGSNPLVPEGAGGPSAFDPRGGLDPLDLDLDPG